MNKNSGRHTFNRKGFDSWLMCFAFMINLSSSSLRDLLASSWSTCYPKSIILCSSFELNNVNSTPLPSPFDEVRNRETEVDCLTHLLSAIASQIFPLKPINPETLHPYSMFQPMNTKLNQTLQRKWIQTRGTWGQIKYMKETHIRMFSFQVDIYPHLEYPHKFRVPDFEQYDENCCPRIQLHLYGIATS